MEGLENQKTVEEPKVEETKTDALLASVGDVVASKQNQVRAQYLSRLGISPGAFNPKEWPKEWLEMKRQRDSIENIKLQENIDNKLTLEEAYSNDAYSIQFLITKTDEEVRRNYINKLINLKIMHEKPGKKQQTLIIFDWDDTLLPTTYLSCSGYIENPTHAIPELANVNNAAARLLELAVASGETYIITNAAQGWVEYSSRTFLPKVAEAIATHKVKVISARTAYEQQFPGDFYRWKVEAFLEIQKNFDRNVITNLICLGDSHIEIDAAHILAKQFTQSLIKTIKYRETPRPEELQKQQELVAEKFETIFISLRNLTIRLEKKSSQTPANAE